MRLHRVQATQFFSASSPEIQHALETEFLLEEGQHSVPIDFPLPAGCTVKTVNVLRRHVLVWKPFMVDYEIKGNVVTISLSSGDYIVTIAS